MATWLVILVIGVPWLGGLCVWGLGDGRPSLQHALASVSSALAGAISIGLLFFTNSGTVFRVPLGGVFGDFSLVLDGMGAYLAVIAAVIGSLAVIFSNDYMHGEAQLSRYYSLMLLFIGAMIGLVLSGSLFWMFIFWEITAFCSYALISFHNDDPKAVASGIKALIITQVGGIGLMAGALLIYAQTGNYEINQFLESSHTFPSVMLSVIAFGFLIAAAAKSAQIPFQTWLPDAMEAPTPISALIHAATMVNAGVYLLARFYPAFQDVPGWTMSIVVIGLGSALLAAIMAAVVHDIKRVLAYSTISQLGYMVYAIGCGAVLASQFHLLSHSTFKALLFLAAGAIIHATGTRDMRQMGGLGEHMPFTRIALIVGGLGLAGIPIANGFFSKEFILEQGNQSGLAWAYWGMVIVAGLTAYYTIRMISLVFFGKSAHPMRVHDAGSRMRISLSSLVLGTFLTWMLFGPFSKMMAESLPFHHLHHERTWIFVRAILSNPATWLAMVVVAVGFIAWWSRDLFTGLEKFFVPFKEFASRGFGFEDLNQAVIKFFQALSSQASRIQTGQLNWNVFGIVITIFIVLILSIRSG